MTVSSATPSVFSLVLFGHAGRLRAKMLLAVARNALIFIYLSFPSAVVPARSEGRSSSSSYKVKERHHVPRQWFEAGPAAADDIIQLQIGLKQSQFAELERHLYEGGLLPFSRWSRATAVHSIILTCSSIGPKAP